ncbi:MAG: response regulator transcription factor [Flavobacteriales bacterium]|jgi:DNA-binding response OmpR family regulator
MSKKVIVVEDDLPIAELLQLHISDLGLQTVHFADGQKALEYLTVHPFDLLILDVNLPGRNGFEICHELRSLDIQSPILMLTAKTDESDKVNGLELGADDYLTKPFGMREFIARIKALLRRGEALSGKADKRALLQFKDLVIDRNKLEVTLRNKRIDLTPKEFELLCKLASQPGVSFDRKQLLSIVWGSEFEGFEHTVNSHINRLRAKIEDDPNSPVYVLTTWGVGYRFNDQLSN